MSRFVIGTAGHIDHGKTTLVRALTGVNTDRLAEEKRRGISIELGFAAWDVAPDVQATIIDVPGHRRLVHTMIAGASGIELVLMVVAADEGVMPQTREHALVCKELGITQALVVITKIDRVDEETVTLAAAEARELLDGFEVDVTACSALRREGLDEVRDRVAARLRHRERTGAHGPARLWVDRVFHVRGTGVVVTGTLLSGGIDVGQPARLLGPQGSLTTLARELRVHDASVSRACAPVRLAVNLPLGVQDVRRGDLLTTDLDLTTTSAVDAVYRGPLLRRGAELSLHVGSARVAVRVTRSGSVRDGGEQLVRLVLDEPRPLSGGDRFILRGSTSGTGSVAGGGTVLDARPHPRSRGEARRLLCRSLSEADQKAVLEVLFAEVTPHELVLRRLHGRLAIDSLVLQREADSQREAGAVVRCGDGLLKRSTLGLLADRARTLVADHLRRAPLDRGLPLATLTQKLADLAGPAAASAAIVAARARKSATDEDAIRVVGDVAALARTELAIDPKLARAVERAGEEIERASLRGVTATRVCEVTRTSPAETRAILAWLERESAAVRAGELWFAPAVVAELRAVLVRHLETAGTVTVSEFKELGKLPRNQAVLLLELFDKMNVTRRLGDVRLLAHRDEHDGSR